MNLCEHSRIMRLSKTAVRCASCGETIIKPIKTEKQNPYKNTVINNFDRNFSNKYQEELKLPYKRELYVNSLNKLWVEYNNVFDSDPPKYKMILNGEVLYNTKNEIAKIIQVLKLKKFDL